MVSCRPSLVGLITRDNWPCELQGLTLKNVGLSLYHKQKKIASDLGEMLFTHFGVSGPMVLTYSSMMKKTPVDYRLSLDLKPGLTEEQLHKRLLKDFDLYQNKKVINALVDLLPQRLILVVLGFAKIDENKRTNQISKKERQNLVDVIKKIPIEISDFYSMDSAIITAGGVSVKDVNPKTMESKKILGLYFAGELLDLDGTTGGFNLQIAASTGWLAGLEK